GESGDEVVVVGRWRWCDATVVVVAWCDDDEGEVDGGDDVGCGVVMAVMMVWWVSAAGWPESGRWCPEII
ncbi:hypothetical protein Tco_1248842, partial [Tanacetum coccineum]